MPSNCEDTLSTGPFSPGYVAGNSTCHAVEFEVPYDEEYIYLIIGKETIVVV